jgi:hypothetical protein
MLYQRRPSKKTTPRFYHKVLYQNKKLVLSLYTNKEDRSDLTRIKTFYRLYEKYRDKAIFLLVDTKSFEDFIPHIGEG